MYLNSIRIDDFGCFRNARLDDLSSGLVVIGGPQRAGKSTFMDAMRQFPEGIDRLDSLPPATDTYRIDAEITVGSAEYRYVLSGHASPSVSPIDGGPEITAQDIFNPITERQYRNLYTISLDELRELPAGIENPDDLARVLLGGAYGDIAEIPAVQESFNNRAYDIGLSKGDPTAKTGRLHAPYQKIREGITKRQQASEQVNEHTTVTTEVEQTQTRLSDIDEKLSQERHTRDRLNILNELFEPIQRIERLSIALDEDADTQVDEFPHHLNDRLEHFKERFESAIAKETEARDTFDREASIADTGHYYEWLLEHQEALKSAHENHKLWERTVTELSDTQTELRTEESRLKTAVAELHSEWDASFEHIDRIDTNAVDTARLTEKSTAVEKLRAQYKELDASLETNLARLEELETKLTQMDDEYDGTRIIDIPKRKPAVIATFALVAGVGISFVATPLVGGVIGLAVLAIGMYAIESTITVETAINADPYREIKVQSTSLQSDIEAQKGRLETLERDRRTSEKALTDLVTELGLPSEIPIPQVGEFYDRVVELDNDIKEYRSRRNRFDQEKERLAVDLRETAVVLENVVEISWEPETTLEHADEVLTALEAVTGDLERARDVQRTTRDRNGCIANINDVLTQWDEEKSVEPQVADGSVLQAIQQFSAEAERIKQLKTTLDTREMHREKVVSRLTTPSARDVFEPIRTDTEPLIDVARELAAEYADSEGVADEIREIHTRIQELEEQRENLQKRAIELEKRRDQLTSDDDLQAAQAKIDEGRVEFERLGEAYAVNRIAESMVQQLHERLMEEVVHSLIDDASEIFSQITQDYDGIELGGDIQALEFRALRDGRPNHGVRELSRATAEQLFLAVRLARIRQTDVSLPVVLDDAATNFDPGHLNRVLQIVDELSSTHQVFFLTCHPEFVRRIGANGRSAQYWSLEEGVFTSRESASALEQSLSAD